MQRRGNVVRKEGSYSIVEVFEVHMDSTTKLAGYNLIGPGVGRPLLIGLEQAIALMDSFLAKRNVSGGPTP